MRVGVCFRLQRVLKINLGVRLMATQMKMPQNEPILEYRAGSEERRQLDKSLHKYYETTTDVPIVIGDEEIFTDNVRYQLMPFNHSKKLAKFSYASKDHINKAIQVAVGARQNWESIPLADRASIMLKAADLCANKYRMELNATTMLGQGKTIIQAEIDAACELADFLRFNSYFALQLINYQPISTSAYTDSIEYRGLEGFVAAISPFNFTAIGGNLSSCPALMGNTVLWKPSDTAMLSNYIVFKILREAGVPAGVINFVPADGPTFGSAITSSPELSAVNFTGSVPTFQKIWKMVGSNLEVFRDFPRLVGECGGKNFHFVHHSSDIDTVVAASIRSAFEYQGQKCSACSRMFVPQSLWPTVKDKLIQLHSQLKLGSPMVHGTFMTAVIDEIAFDRIKSYVDHAKNSSTMQVIAGGKCDKSIGFFIEPTIVETSDPHDRIMKEEIFGPVLTVYAYPDDKCEDTLALINKSTPFALTGSIFSKDEQFTQHAKSVLRFAAGNLYLNDKSTGAVVGQQPFGGARMSGTNDKAGSPHYVLKWTSPLVVKTTHIPQTAWSYPSME